MNTTIESETSLVYFFSQEPGKARAKRARSAF